jgi:hypothetical protein
VAERGSVAADAVGSTPTSPPNSGDTMGIKQYRITSQSMDLLPQENDCVLPDDDPIHAIRAAQFMGGIGSGQESDRGFIRKMFTIGDEEQERHGNA